MRLKTTLAVALLAGLASADLAAQRDSVYDPAYESSGGYGVQTLDERVAKLEKRLSSDTLMEMLKRMEQLQGDVAKMRGKMEELSHEVEILKKQQKDMYLDLEQRLQPSPSPQPSIEGAAPVEGQAPAAAAPPLANPVPNGTPRPVAAAVPPAAPVGRQEAYDKAFNLLKEGKYPESVRSFKGFLSTYPSGEYVDNAVYWMGEAYYVLRDFPASRDSFRKLIRDLPQSPKVPDAMLKLGYIEYDASQWGKAREQLNDVIKQFPGSNAAKLAEKRLAKMKQEGH